MPDMTTSTTQEDGPSVEVSVGSELRTEAAERDNDLGRLMVAMRGVTPVWVNLRQCRQFDVIALLHVLAATAQRSNRDLVTRFRLPSDSKARQFLRMKSFPSAVRHVAHVPFRFLVDATDVRYFGERSSAHTQMAHGDAATAILDYLSERRFFAFRPYRLGSIMDRSTLIGDEWEHWRNPLLLRALEHKLDRDPSDFTRVVVQELLVNLLRNVSQGIVITASQIDTVGGQRRLTIGAWQGASEPQISLCQRFLQVIAAAAFRDGKDEFDIRSTPLPVVDLERLAQQSGPDVHSTTLDLFEHGLQAMYQSVINVFDGYLEIWSDHMFARISGGKAGEPARYLVHFDHNGIGELNGNVIAVRIPLADD
jgi:hypothetical protein